MSVLLGIIIAFAIIGAFIIGMVAMFRISESYNSKIRESWTAWDYAPPPQPKPRPAKKREVGLTDAEFARAKNGEPIRKVY